MKRYAFISRHVPTETQYAIAKKSNIEIHLVGDMDAFSTCLIDSLKELEKTYEGIICVHPLIALTTFTETKMNVGVFNSVNRDGVFETTSLVITKNPSQ